MKVAAEHHYSGVSPFVFSAAYSELEANSKWNIHSSHVHDQCEIYVNVSGDASFIVEDVIYPVKPGDVIITRPFEHHHSVYHSNKKHKYFWILFSSTGNEELLDIFFKRKLGKANRLTPPLDKLDELISVCHELTKEENDPLTKYGNFFRLMLLLKSCSVGESTGKKFSSDITLAIEYIDANFSRPLKVEEIASAAHVSVNTLERHFIKGLNLTPSAYIRKKRLSNAVKLLSQGYTVSQAAEQSGFRDYSGFISLFRRTYGLTPLKYKKIHSKSNSLSK